MSQSLCSRLSFKRKTNGLKPTITRGLKFFMLRTGGLRIYCAIKVNLTICPIAAS